jgi:phosphatidylglycerophosphatase A
MASYAAEHAQKKYQIKDPSWIVVDEFLGMLTGWICLTATLSELSWQINVLHFFFFRFFDILKFWPASYFDKKMLHGAGVILDDIVSGVYSFIATYFIIFISDKYFS